MILSIGEIIADMMGNEKERDLSFEAFCGGAPFNVAVNAKQAGADVGFVGCVGNDVLGRFLRKRAEQANLNYLDIQIDGKKNTTLAFVERKEGERDFSFHRYDTADYQIDFDKIDFDKYDDVQILHVGSLMLSEEKGRDLATRLFNEGKKRGIKISFDINLRLDLYDSIEEIKRVYKPYIELADIIKFSADELILYTNIDDLLTGVKGLAQENQLFIVTLGEKGSMYYYNGEWDIISACAVKPLDTTGAGDAFFGTFLAAIEKNTWTKEKIENAMRLGNEKGAKTTQFLGAVQL